MTFTDIEKRGIELKKVDAKELITAFSALFHELKSFKVYPEIEIMEKLLFKMQYNCFSLLNLLNKTKFAGEEFYDIPSIFTLTRTLIENYVFFEYLFIMESCDELLEKDDRVLNYKIDGLKRLKFIAKLQDDQKLKNEINNELKNITPKISFPKTNSKGNNGWDFLIMKSRLNDVFFRALWSRCSNYAHSEYIFIKDINNYFSNQDVVKERILCHSALLMILALTIDNLSIIYTDFSKKEYNGINLKQNHLIETYIMFNKNDDEFKNRMKRVKEMFNFAN